MQWIKIKRRRSRNRIQNEISWTYEVHFLLPKIVNCAFSLSELFNLALSSWFMQTIVKSYARVLKCLVLFKPIFTNFFLPRLDSYSAFSGIFRHVQTFSGLITHIQKLLGHINVYLNPVSSWHIQNPRIFRHIATLCTYILLSLV